MKAYKRDYISSTAIFYEINKFIPLTKEENIYLPEKAKENPEFKKRLLEGCLHISLKVAQNYLGRGLDILELISEGNYGILKAVNSKTFEHKSKFSTYAYSCAKLAILDSLRKFKRNKNLHILSKNLCDLLEDNNIQNPLSELIRSENNKKLEDAIKSLNEEEKDLVTKIYKLELPLKSIYNNNAERQRVFRRKKKVLNKLRFAMGC